MDSASGGSSSEHERRALEANDFWNADSPFRSHAVPQSAIEPEAQSVPPWNQARHEQETSPSKSLSRHLDSPSTAPPPLDHKLQPLNTTEESPIQGLQFDPVVLNVQTQPMVAFDSFPSMDPIELPLEIRGFGEKGVQTQKSAGSLVSRISNYDPAIHQFSAHQHADFIAEGRLFEEMSVSSMEPALESDVPSGSDSPLAPWSPRSDLGMSAQLSDVGDDTRSEVSDASVRPAAPSSPPPGKNEIFFTLGLRALWRLETPVSPLDSSHIQPSPSPTTPALTLERSDVGLDSNLVTPIVILDPEAILEKDSYERHGVPQPTDIPVPSIALVRLESPSSNQFTLREVDNEPSYSHLSSKTKQLRSTSPNNTHTIHSGIYDEAVRIPTPQPFKTMIHTGDTDEASQSEILEPFEMADMVQRPFTPSDADVPSTISANERAEPSKDPSPDTFKLESSESVPHDDQLPAQQVVVAEELRSGGGAHDEGLPQPIDASAHGELDPSADLRTRSDKEMQALPDKLDDVEPVLPESGDHDTLDPANDEPHAATEESPQEHLVEALTLAALPEVQPELIPLPSRSPSPDPEAVTDEMPFSASTPQPQSVNEDPADGPALSEVHVEESPIVLESPQVTSVALDQEPETYIPSPVVSATPVPGADEYVVPAASVIDDAKGRDPSSRTPDDEDRVDVVGLDHNLPSSPIAQHVTLVSAPLDSPPSPEHIPLVGNVAHLEIHADNDPIEPTETLLVIQDDTIVQPSMSIVPPSSSHEDPDILANPPATTSALDDDPTVWYLPQPKSFSQEVNIPHPTIPEIRIEHDRFRPGFSQQASGVGGDMNRRVVRNAEDLATVDRSFEPPSVDSSFSYPYAAFSRHGALSFAPAAITSTATYSEPDIDDAVSAYTNSIKVPCSNNPFAGLAVKLVVECL